MKIKNKKYIKDKDKECKSHPGLLKIKRIDINALAKDSHITECLSARNRNFEVYSVHSRFENNSHYKKKRRNTKNVHQKQINEFNDFKKKINQNMNEDRSKFIKEDLCNDLKKLNKHSIIKKHYERSLSKESQNINLIN